MSIRTLFAGAAFAAAILSTTPSALAEETTAVPSADGGSPAKLYAGAALMTTGGLALLGGGISYFALSASTDAGGDDPYRGAKTASVLSMVLGGAGLAVGLPLILTAGSSDVATDNDKNNSPRNTASAAPTIRVGVGAAAATWQF